MVHDSFLMSPSERVATNISQFVATEPGGCGSVHSGVAVFARSSVTVSSDGMYADLVPQGVIAVRGLPIHVRLRIHVS